MSIISSYPVPTDQELIDSYRNFIDHASYPCVAAKAAMTKGHLRFFVSDSMSNLHLDNELLHFMYSFVDEYRSAQDMYHSAVVIFRYPKIYSEAQFDELLWKKLQSLSSLDADYYCYDDRVSKDPSSPSFSFSLKAEAFYILGLHPLSSRLARRFEFPAMVFNPHAQFETLRNMMKYEVMKTVVRKRDMLYSGSVNPMLEDFGKRSEVYQYSGRDYNDDWNCPLKINHGSPEHYTAS